MKYFLIIILLFSGILFYSFDKEEVVCGSYLNEQHQFSGIPPAAKTGAPNESLCYDCHAFEILNDTVGGVAMEFNGGVNFYKPDSTYLINVKVKQFGNTVFGFESTMLDSNTAKIGAYNILDSTKTAYQTFTQAGWPTNREYISHKDVISNMSNDSLEWQFEWTAPSNNAGVLTLYSAGVTNPTFISIAAGNVYNDSLKIYPDPSITTVKELAKYENDVVVYPNPMNSNSTIEYVIEQEEVVIISFFNINGQFIKSIDQGVQEKGTHQVFFSNKGLTPGLYFVKLSHGASIKLIVSE